MNPTPRTLVLLMSAVGLGLSLADATWANEQAPADALTESAAPLCALEPRAQRSGGLHEYQTVEHDRHAVALALVLMADAPAAHRPRIVGSRKARAAAMARHLAYERVSEPAGRMATVPIATETGALGLIAAEVVAGEPVAGEPIGVEPIGVEPIAEPIAAEFDAAEPSATELLAAETARDDVSTSVAGQADAAAPYAGEPEPAVMSVAIEAPATDVAFEVPVTATVNLAVAADGVGASSGPTALDTRPTQPGAEGSEAASAASDPTITTTSTSTSTSTAADLPAESVTAPAAVAPTRSIVTAALFDTAAAPAEIDAVASSHHARHVLAALADVRALHPGEGLLGKPARSGSAMGHVDRVLLDLLAVREGRHATTSAEAATAPNPFGGKALAVSAARLDDVRGGFVTASGLQLSFGIERAVYLNGNLVTTTSLQLNELGKISGTQGLPVSAELNRALVQNGPGNTFVSNAVSAATLGNVIQNTLDNQKIQTITRIDAAVSAATVLRGIDLQSSMRGAISQSLQR